MNPARATRLLGRLTPVWLALSLAGCATAPRPPDRVASQAQLEPEFFDLQADGQWLLNRQGNPRFDASALLLRPSGELLTLSDEGPTIYRIAFRNSSNADLVPLPGLFAPEQLAPLAREKFGHYDCEGLAQDSQGRLYLCEEANRWILRCDPATRQVERLPIDWAPAAKFFSADRNASFEGIAIGEGKLYVANERSDPVILVVELASCRLIDQFVVRPKTGSLLGILHYSDLSWQGGSLFVLCRHHRVVLKVDPATRRVLAEYNYQAVEDALGYKTLYPTGVMEGLAVDATAIWLVTDNNGLGRRGAPGDRRPTLIRCPRPDRAATSRTTGAIFPR